jgi:hypothetical protein
MSEGEVRKYAEAFDVDEVVKPNPPAPNLPDLVIEKDGTQFGFWFGADGLTAVDVSWLSGPARMKADGRREFCVDRSTAGKVHR